MIVSPQNNNVASSVFYRQSHKTDVSSQKIVLREYFAKVNYY